MEGGIDETAYSLVCLEVRLLSEVLFESTFFVYDEDVENASKDLEDAIGKLNKGEGVNPANKPA